MKVIWDGTPKPIWEALADYAQAPMQQRWVYGEVSEKLGAATLRAEIREGGVPLGIVQLLHRRVMGQLGLSLTTRGPIWIGQPDLEKRIAALALLRAELRQRAGRSVLVTPRSEAEAEAMGGAGFTEVLTPATVARLALDRDARGRMAQKWRNRLVAAERAQIDLRELPREIGELGWLVAADRSQQRARRYRALPPAFLGAWLERAPQDVVTFATHEGADVTAAMLFLRHGNTATYHIGWTGEEGRRVSAHNLLLWTAMEHFRVQGGKAIDLGLLDTERAPGLARFKLGSGAQAVRLGGTWLAF